MLIQLSTLGRQGGNGPKVQIINGSLLISHVNIEREQVDGWECASAENLKEGRESIPIQIGLRGGGIRVFRHFGEVDVG